MKKSLDQLLRDSLDQPQQLPPVDEFWQDFAHRLDGSGSEGSASEPPPTATPDALPSEVALPTASGSSLAVKSWMVIGAAVAGLALMRLTTIPVTVTQEVVADPSAVTQISINASGQKENAALLNLNPPVSLQTTAIGSNTSTPQTQTGQVTPLAATPSESTEPSNTRLSKVPKPFSANQNTANTSKAISKSADNQFFAKKSALLNDHLADPPTTKAASGTEGTLNEGQKTTPKPGGIQPESGQKEILKPKSGLLPDQASVPALPEKTAPEGEPITEGVDITHSVKEGMESAEPTPLVRQQWLVPDLGSRSLSILAQEKQVTDFSGLKKKEKAHRKAHPLTGYVFAGTEPFYSQRYQPNVFQLLSFGIGAQRPMLNDWGARAEIWLLQTEGLPVSVNETIIIDPDGNRTTEERTVDVYRMNRVVLNLSAVKRIGSVSLLGGLSLGRWTSGQLYESFSSTSLIFGGSSSGSSSGGGPLPEKYFNRNYLGLKLGVEVNPFDSRWLAGASFYQQANDLTSSNRWTANQDFMLYVGWKF